MVKINEVEYIGVWEDDNGKFWILDGGNPVSEWAVTGNVEYDPISEEWYREVVFAEAQMEKVEIIKDKHLVCGYCCHHCADRDCSGNKEECAIQHEYGAAYCQAQRE